MLSHHHQIMLLKSLKAHKVLPLKLIADLLRPDLSLRELKAQ